MPKEPDPERAPLICKAFDLYATGAYNLRTLQAELHRLGLRNKSGGIVSVPRLSQILNDSFYIGIIQIKRNGQVFAGIHQPLISKSLFDRVQTILDAKTNTRIDKHAFTFRRLARCYDCGRVLTGELQKGNVYYRCHSPACRSVCVREDVVNERVRDLLATATLNDDEFGVLQKELQALRADWTEHTETSRQALSLQLDNILRRLTRLTDALLDGSIDHETYNDRKRALLLDRASLEEQMSQTTGENANLPARLSELFERSKNLSLSYEVAIPDERRDMVANLTSNLSVKGKEVVVELCSPYREIANRSSLAKCGPFRNRLRTSKPRLKDLFDFVVGYVTAEAVGSNDAAMDQLGRHGNTGR